MKNTLTTLLLGITLTCCNSKPTLYEDLNAMTFTSERVGKAYIGMTVEELKGEYSNYTLSEEPVWNYGVDGGGNGIKISDSTSDLMFAWTLRDDHKIHSITILSPVYKSQDGLHVNMTVKELLKVYPNMTVHNNYITGFEEFIDTEKNMTFTFLTDSSNNVGDYPSDETEFESEPKNLDKKVDWISILKK